MNNIQGFSDFNPIFYTLGNKGLEFRSTYDQELCKKHSLTHCALYGASKIKVLGG